MFNCGIVIQERTCGRCRVTQRAAVKTSDALHRNRESIVDAEKIFFAVHFPGHWVLAEIDLVSHSISFFDSLQVRSFMYRM